MQSDAPDSFKPEDLLGFKVVGDIDISPDGRWVVYELQEIDKEGDTTVSDLWIVSTDGGEPRRLTFGPKTNSKPRFSPDGSRIAFLSSRSGLPSQLYILRVDGGEAKQLTTRKGGAGQAVFSPDGSTILFSAVIEPEEPPDAPRVVTRTMYKVDGSGFILNSPTHLFVVPAEGGETKQLTTGEANESSPAWSRDGKRIVFSRSRTGRSDAHRLDLWTMDAGGEGLRQVTRDCAIAMAPSFSPDGRRIAFYGSRREGDSREQLWTVSAEGGDERLLTSEDVEISSFPLGKTGPPIWSEDGSEIAVVLARESVSLVARVSTETGEVRDAVADERQLTMLAAAPRARTIAYLWSDLRLCGNLGAARWDGSGQKQLVNMNEAWAKGRSWPEAALREFKSASGERNQGILFYPPGRERRGLPLLVDVHGGPHTYVDFGFPYHPYWYVLLSRGWAVLSLNPVGSAAFGREHADKLRGRWGERDLPEHLAAVDELVKEGIVDGDRVAIAGKSYGGYMTAWAIGKSKRFRAAVCSAPVTNLESHFGTSDSGYYVDPYDMGGDITEARERYHALSPIRYAGDSTTPTLILQGEEDQRCPVGQAEELFAALIKAGKAPVELVRYPGGTHQLASTGKPSHRVDYHRRIVDWLETFCAAS
jgi:dipeptidyl aminopeptidase/acylaminoacyl peptidase